MCALDRGGKGRVKPSAGNVIGLNTITFTTLTEDVFTEHWWGVPLSSLIEEDIRQRRGVVTSLVAIKKHELRLKIG